MNSEDILSIEILGKKVCIAESHHFMLRPWAEIRQHLETAPILISLDKHTDTHDPFLAYCYKYDKNGCEKVSKDYDEEFANELVDHIKYNDLSTVDRAISNLRFDEHITTAIKSNIISKAFIIACDNSFNVPESLEMKARTESFMEIQLALSEGIEHPLAALPKIQTYPISEDRLYIPRWIPDYFDGDTEEDIFAMALENEFLQEKFNVFAQMSSTDVDGNIFNKPYILDIDLDYFHGKDSINPTQKDVFYNLIKNAEIITIALERECVKIVQEEYAISETYDSEWLLGKMKNHIEQALA